VTAPSQRRFRPGVERLEDRAVPAAFSAASPAELVAAVSAANATPEADTITLVAGKTFIFTAADITTSGGAAALPDIAATGGPLTIVGNGDVLERDTNNFGFRFFDVAAGASLTLRDLTLQGGFTQYRGGALFNRGTLTLDGVIVQNNQARGAAGGGVYSEGNLIIEGSTIQGNSALGSRGRDGDYYFFFGGWIVQPGSPGGSAFGGGVYIGGGTLSISNSSIKGNTARGGDGGDGVSVKADGVLLRSAGGDGGDAFGGGLYAAGGTITLLNTQISQNSATGGQGGNGGAKSPSGAPGQGTGGGLYIDPLALVYLDPFTEGHAKGNKASTSDNNIHGPYDVIS
jgi:hypothetical protein